MTKLYRNQLDPGIIFLINCKTACPAGLDFYYGETAKANFRTACDVSILSLSMLLLLMDVIETAIYVPYTGDKDLTSTCGRYFQDT